jgi:predicted Zn-dependent protease
VTRFWYVRPVDPGTLTLTGLTRDGTFLIEEGHVVRRLADLRWNESLLRAFARLDAVGRQPAVVSMEETTVVTPAVRIPGFRFVS